MIELIILFVFCVGGGYYLFKGIGESLFGKKSDGPTFIDKSVHYHEHKTINIIDPDTKRNVYQITESKKLK